MIFPMDRLIYVFKKYYPSRVSPLQLLELIERDVSGGIRVECTSFGTIVHSATVWLLPNKLGAAASPQLHHQHHLQNGSVSSSGVSSLGSSSLFSSTFFSSTVSRSPNSSSHYNNRSNGSQVFTATADSRANALIKAATLAYDYLKAMSSIADTNKFSTISPEETEHQLKRFWAYFGSRPEGDKVLRVLDLELGNDDQRLKDSFDNYLSTNSAWQRLFLQLKFQKILSKYDCKLYIDVKTFKPLYIATVHLTDGTEIVATFPNAKQAIKSALRKVRIHLQMDRNDPAVGDASLF